MVKQKQIEPLVGKQLIHKVKELGNLSKSEKAKICGYYSVTKNGLERVNMVPFLNALIEAEGIELDGTGRDNGHEERSEEGQIPVRANGSMDSNRIVRVKRAENPIVKPQPLSQRVQQQEVQQPQIEQPEQPEQVFHLESVAESTREESVYGSGWSLAQLMNEFSGR